MNVDADGRLDPPARGMTRALAIAYVGEDRLRGRSRMRWISISMITCASLLSACELAGDAELADTTQALPTTDAGCLDGPCCTLQQTADEPAALQRQLGCGPTYVYRKRTNTGMTLPGLRGSFCPDTSRGFLHHLGKLGYLAGYCDTCLCVPTGQVFVIWSEELGPTCPSGCRPSRPMPL